MKTFFCFFLLFLSSITNSQTGELENLVKNLKNADEHFFECNSTYWKIISKGKSAIPLLIEKLNDTTSTSATSKCKKQKLVVGDLAFLILDEIMSLPMYEVTKMQFDLIEPNGCLGGIFDYIVANRSKFKSQISHYYQKNVGNFKFKAFEKQYLTDCRKANNIRGYYTTY